MGAPSARPLRPWGTYPCLRRHPGREVEEDLSGCQGDSVDQPGCSSVAGPLGSCAGSAGGWPGPVTGLSAGACPWLAATGWLGGGRAWDQPRAVGEHWLCSGRTAPWAGAVHFGGKMSRRAKGGKGGDLPADGPRLPRPVKTRSGQTPGRGQGGARGHRVDWQGELRTGRVGAQTPGLREEPGGLIAPALGTSRRQSPGPAG